MGTTTTDKAKVGRAKADIRTIMSALEMYKLDVGSYPLTVYTLNVLLVNDSDPGADVTTIAKWNGPYLKKLPTDPFAAGATDPYNYTSAGTTYTLTADGPTGDVVDADKL